LRLGRDLPLVLDCDDAVFHQYDMNPYSTICLLWGAKHSALMRRVSLVVAGNQYIAEYALRAGGPKVETLTTVVNLNRYRSASLNNNGYKDGIPTIGWNGQKSTASFLQQLDKLI
jgi:hypothetical protein